MKKSLIQHLHNCLSSLGVGEKDHLFIGVSGGMDSMVLLHLAKQAGYDVTATHINFHLRGEESNMDAALVERYCKQQSISNLIYDINKENISISKEDNIQIRARKIRYEWWNTLLSEFPGSWMLTAHHLNDAFESSLFNLIRGTGIRGTGGIRTINDRFIRPLLEVTQQELHQYQKEFNIPFSTDSSNETDAYSRNKIRHHITSAILEQFPNALSGFKASHKRIEGELEVWNFLFERWKSENINQDSDTIIEITVTDDYIVFAANFLEQTGIPYSLAIEFMRSNLSTRNGTLEYNDMKLIRSQNGFDLCFTTYPQDEVSIPQPGQYTSGNTNISIREVSSTDIVIGEPLICCFPLASIRWPIEYRRIKDGDRIQPFGMGGKSKKLQDIFTDAKWSQTQKNNCRVIADQGGVLWIPGLVKSELSRSDPNHKDWIEIRLTYQ